MGWLNIASLILGLVAWILPLLHLNVKGERSTRKLILLFISFSCCAAAILCQLMYQSYLVKIEDFSALMDITRSSVLASSLLLIGTILLNLFAKR